MLCPTCHQEMEPGRVYGTMDNLLHYIQGPSGPDLWTPSGQPIGFVTAPPALGAIVATAVVIGVQPVPGAWKHVHVRTHRCAGCGLHIIDESENQANIGADNARTAVCTRCGSEAYGRDYTAAYGHPATGSATGTVPEGPAGKTRKRVGVSQGAETLFLCNQCVRRMYAPGRAVRAVVATALGAGSIYFGARVMLADTRNLLWPGLLYALGAILIAIAWSQMRGALSSQQDAIDGKFAALRLMRERSAHGPGVIYWTPEKSAEDTFAGE